MRTLQPYSTQQISCSVDDHYASALQVHNRRPSITDNRRTTRCQMAMTHNDVIQMRFKSETINLLTHPCNQFDRLVSPITLLMILHKRQIGLFQNTTTVKGTVTASIISALCATGNSCFKKLAMTCSLSQHVFMSPNTTEKNHIKDLRTSINTVEQQNGGVVKTGACQTRQ